MRWLLRRFRYVRRLESAVCDLLAEAAQKPGTPPPTTGAAAAIVDAIEISSVDPSPVELQMLVWDEGRPRRRYFEVSIREVEHASHH